ncbi:Zinc finger BED domain-containing [Pleurotus pulmonarius]
MLHPMRRTRKTAAEPVIYPGGAMTSVFDANPEPRKRTNKAAALPQSTSSIDAPSKVPHMPNEVVEPQEDPFVANTPTATVTPNTSQLPFTPVVEPAVRQPRVNFNLAEEAEYISFTHVVATPSTPSHSPPLVAPTSSQPLSPLTPGGAMASQTPRRALTTRPRGTPRSIRHRHHIPSRRSDNKHRSSTDDVYAFYEEKATTRTCILCKKVQLELGDPSYRVREYGVNTSSGGLRRHLYTEHLSQWVEACDRAGLKIKAKEALPYVDRYRQESSTGDNHVASDGFPKPKVRKFTPPAFLDAIAECFIANDLSINLIESPELRGIFLMLRDGLRDSDIPHRTALRSRIVQLWEIHLDKIADEMAHALGKISFSTDICVTQTASGPRYLLRLRADLIGFHHIPGSHTGEHISNIFLFVLDRIQITSRIGWVTVDNASNNDTFLHHLEAELKHRNIPFSHIKHHIRCFPHVVNLACKAVIQGITNMDLANSDISEFDHVDHAEHTHRDLIATLRAFIRNTRVSSLRREFFSQVVMSLRDKNLQLLRDVDTRWSSTLLMIDRAILLRAAIDKFINSNEFPELKKYWLTPSEWDSLEVYKSILAVPHAFQQKLSSEKTPTLSHAIPSFEAMRMKWMQQQTKYPHLRNIIQAGLDKLDNYQHRMELSPAYILAMAVNPDVKLRWIAKNEPAKYDSAYALLLAELEKYYHPSITRSDQHEALDLDPEDDPAWADEILGTDLVTASTYNTLEAEVIAYLAETQHGLSPIQYWQDNQARFPTIFSLAMDILPIQGSAVPCERVFSSAKETTTMRRNRISPDLMESLQVLKFYIRKGRELDFSVGTSREAEVANLEMLNAQEHDALKEIMSHYKL